MYSRRLHVNLDDKKDEENTLGLSAAHLLAFLIYKNCYLADAEKMREGNSKIDKIYSTARSISTDSIYRLSQRRKSAQEDLEMALDSMANLVGVRLKSHLQNKLLKNTLTRQLILVS